MKTTSILILSTFFIITSCKYTEAPSAGLAKEMCSCLFVAEQNEEYCESVSKESLILAKWQSDPVERTVTAKGVNYTSYAKMSDDSRFGCTITSIEHAPENRHQFKN